MCLPCHALAQKEETYDLLLISDIYEEEYLCTVEILECKYYFCSNYFVMMPEKQFSLTSVFPYKVNVDKIWVKEDPHSVILYAMNTIFKKPVGHSSISL